LALLLMVATLAVYQPVWQAGFIWDDDAHVTENTTLRTLDGLRRIWFERGATPQYYPLVHTSFWVEYHLWRLDPFGYHLINVLLQALNAILVWLILRRLGVSGAWLAAAIFALHPVHVESVAWVTERKNVLSGFFYLSALFVYLRFCLPDTAKQNPRRSYWLALALYACALLCKSVTCSLPVAVLLLIWWKRGRVRWRDDAVPLLVFGALGVAAGLNTIWMEQHRVGAGGAAYAFSLVQRWLIAGRALWFYAAKLVWPQPLMFFYRPWHIDPAAWWQFLFPLGALAVVGILWTRRDAWGRGPLAAALFFIVTLAPALGFFNVYPFRYAFVADHYQYLASLGLIALFASGVALVLRRWNLWLRPAGNAVCAALLLPLACMTANQAGIYRDAETLYHATLLDNPDCWVCHNNLGVILQKAGDVPEATGEYEEALRLNPRFAEAHYNMGNILSDAGHLSDAITQYEQALQIDPDYAAAHNNLANALLQEGRTEEAITHLESAVRLKPNMAEAHYNLANVLVGTGRIQDAIEQYEEALRLRPNFPQAQNRLAFARSKRTD
jgi:tetratricopeptide (TPR) repeat protein